MIPRKQNSVITCHCERSEAISTHDIISFMDKTNSSWLKTFSIGFSIISFGITIAIVGYFVLATKQNQPSNQPSPTLTTVETASWKTVTLEGFTIKTPNAWKGAYGLSEFPFTPGEIDKTKIYNIIETHRYPTQLYTGYTNRQWFDKINSLQINESYTDQRDRITKITSGKVASGEEYVIFKNEPSESFPGEPATQLKAYVIKEQSIYQFTLSQYNKNGLELFNKVIPTTIIN